MNIDRAGRINLAQVKYVPGQQSARLQEGDVIFNNTNSAELIGKTASFDLQGDWAFSNHMTRLRPPDGISHKFVAYQLHFLWMMGYFLHRCTHHVNQASMSSHTLAQTVPIMLAPTAEQYRIVAAIEEQFSRIDAGVTALQRARRNLQRMRAAVLQAAVIGRLVQQDPNDEPAVHMLRRVLQSRGYSDGRSAPEYLASDPSVHPVPDSWCLASLDILTTEHKYGTSTKCSYEASGLPVLRIPNIRDGHVVRDDLKFAVDASVDLSTSKACSGDLLFVRTNGSRDLIGRAGEVDDCKGMGFASYLIRMRPLREIVVPRYLVLATSAPLLRGEIEARAATSAGQYNVSLTALRSLPIPLPPLPEQRRIVRETDRHLSILDNLEQTVTTALERAQQLRHSVLAGAFGGKLVPQDPSDEPASVLLDRLNVARVAEDSNLQPPPRRSRR